MATSNIVVPANNNTGLYNTSGNGTSTVVTTAVTSGVGTTIPSNNNTGLYNTAGQAPIGIADNISVTGNIAAGGWISAVGNIYGNYVVGNGYYLTGLNISGAYSNANATSLLANFGSNTISTSGNITGGFILGNGSQLTGITTNYSNANVANYLPIFSGNVAAGNVSAVSNVVANIFQTAGTQGNIRCKWSGQHTWCKLCECQLLSR